MKNNGGPSLETYKEALEILAIANKAAARVREENKRLGIPQPFAVGKKLFYLMPDDSIVEIKDGENKID